MKLESDFVTNSKEIGNLVEIFAQIIVDNGGVPDEVFYELIDGVSPDLRNAIGRALVDTMLNPVFPEAIELQIEQTPFNGICAEYANTDFSVAGLEGYEDANFNSQKYAGRVKDFSVWSNSKKVRFQIYKPEEETHIRELLNFAKSRNLEFPNMKELWYLHLALKEAEGENKSLITPVISSHNKRRSFFAELSCHNTAMQGEWTTLSFSDYAYFPARDNYYAVRIPS